MCGVPFALAGFVVRFKAFRFGRARKRCSRAERGGNRVRTLREIFFARLFKGENDFIDVRLRFVRSEKFRGRKFVFCFQRKRGRFAVIVAAKCVRAERVNFSFAQCYSALRAAIPCFSESVNAFQKTGEENLPFSFLFHGTFAVYAAIRSVFFCGNFSGVP